MRFGKELAGVSGVYQITCTANGKTYYGQTTDMRRRWNEHVAALRCHKHHNPVLQEDYDMYGEDAFLFEIVAVLEDANARDEMEKKLIDAMPDLSTSYNIFSGGRDRVSRDPTFGERIATKTRGRERSEEFKRRAAESATAQWQNDEYRAKMVESAKKQWEDPEYRALMLRANLGKRWTEEQRLRASEKHKGAVLSEETKHKMSLKRRGEDNGRAKLTTEQVRTIRARAEDGESDLDLAREYGVAPTTIHNIIRRKTWKYV